jgi:hypothetical protein
MPKQLVTRGQVATVVSRMLGEIDAFSSEQAHFAYLQSEGIMNVANLSSSISRGDALLVLYRIAAPAEDLCDLDPTLPGCEDEDTDEDDDGEEVIIKEGDLQISLNPSSPANMSSVPTNGVSKFATVDFTAGTKDVTISTVSLVRGGLGASSEISRVYFEVNGVRISSRSTISSDNTAVLSFAPALVVPAGETVSVDLVAELAALNAGSEHNFRSTAVESSAATVNGVFTTATLRTANYTVRGVTFTNQNVSTTYQGNEATVELGRFQLQNIGTSTIDVNVKAVTLRNVGNGDLSTGLMDLKLLRSGTPVSSSVIVNGRDLTFVLSDTIKDGQTAVYTIDAKVAQVENTNGDTYKFILRQTTDLNASEAPTGFRTAVTSTANVANDTTASQSYTVSGGELRFVRDSSETLSKNVTKGSLQVVFMKGTINAKQPILLEDPQLQVALGAAANQISNVAKKFYMQIGSTVMTWTPSPTLANPVAQFDGSVTVNGTVPFMVYADIDANATYPAPVAFQTFAYSSFSNGRIEYLSNQNAVAAASVVGTVAGINVTVVDTQLAVSRADGLGTIVYSTNNAQSKTIYGVKLTNNQDNPVRVNAITITPSNPAAFNNGMSLTLKNGSTALQTKTLNGATTFNGLNIIVSKATSVDLTFEADFLSTMTAGDQGTFAVSFNAGDVKDNITSNDATVTGTPATSALLSIIDA